MLYIRSHPFSSPCVRLLRLTIRRISTSPSSIETPHSTSPSNTEIKPDPLDTHILHSIRHLLPLRPFPPSLAEMYEQYRERQHVILDEQVLVTEEHPRTSRRACPPISGSSSPSSSILSASIRKEGNQAKAETEEEGDGTVLVIHALLKPFKTEQSAEIDKISICSGFVLNVKPGPASDSVGEDEGLEGEYIMTCAHTLEEMYRHLPKPHHHHHSNPYLRSSPEEEARSISFILTSTGLPIPLQGCLSSIPRSDLALFQAHHPSKHSRTSGQKCKKLKPLPITPYPVPPGQKVGVHLFSALPDGEPIIKLNKRHNKLEFDEESESQAELQRIQKTSGWIGGRAFKRWGVGEMLGYRSYTGQEVEAGSSHTLPHLQISPLPTSGSSGGPIVRLDTGTVVGLISGRRLDNRVEGERGWGAAAEGIFEMFGLPGFVPASKRK